MMDSSSCYLLVASVLLIIVVGWFFSFKTCQPSGSRRVCVIVLGDVGRSPRMQYHSLSFAKEGYHVDLVGYGNSPVVAELRENIKVQLLAVSEAPKKPRFLPRLLYYILKTVYQFQLILVVLLKTHRHAYVLVQNPPAIPTLSAAWLICLVRGSKLIIDWHNYGYTILALNLSNHHLLVKLSKIYEGFFGRLATHNICVTKAMKHDLLKRWNVKATTLHDRPPERFQFVDIDSRHELFLKLAEAYDVFKVPAKQSLSETRFSLSTKEGPRLKLERPALLISSTSWTEDEDFSILLKALELYDNVAATPCTTLPHIVCIITGKGPLKEHYVAIMAKMVLKNVQICTPWLESGDYPTLVGSADLGICLHTSSSGLDLPMKVVDMFGCGVPVCAIDFSCLSELVQHGKNGLVFQNAHELADHLVTLLDNFPSDQKQLNNFRENVKEFQKLRWHPCWKETFYNKL